MSKNNSLKISFGLIAEEKDRNIAICECYGLKNVLNEKEITIQNGEIITAWAVEGFNDIEDLSKAFNEEIIVSIYNSGL